ncbi:MULTISPECIES: arsenate reductase ArsC [unclassified Leisingera]|uniref:arsenate reductase ArsC n=1 Tax=unclassified Leisingera TaxID=2614906 RepID=UPI0002EAF465|nr:MULTISPECIES: arsenate reductase ArsC [unclassified Leisingera]KIC26693.1 arsenate reductase [Leisingera sp. ANG-S3]KIC48297.1 arsenate reductase [Leisingera sp. ANG-S]KID10410.1 arsenate reductase [Leisingera sp. ANG1]
MNILVLCTGNSARSILLESIFNTLGAGRTRAYSAGSNPTGKVHPQSLVLLNELGHDVSGARSKSWDEFAEADAPEMDIVITVCASAAGETCPIWPGAPVRTHWGVEDPAAADQPEWDKAFRTAYITLEKRAKALLELPFENMQPAELSEQLKRIGEIA